MKGLLYLLHPLKANKRIFIPVKGSNTFGKQEKLKRRKLIQQVFSNGKAINAFPLRLIYVMAAEELDNSVKTGVSVSSRNFKKAVDRNRVKRLLREAYRINKSNLLLHADEHKIHLAVFIIYTDKSLPDFATINQKMKLVLDKLIKATSEVATKSA